MMVSCSPGESDTTEQMRSQILAKIDQRSNQIILCRRNTNVYHRYKFHSAFWAQSLFWNICAKNYAGIGVNKSISCLFVSNNLKFWNVSLTIKVFLLRFYFQVLQMKENQYYLLMGLLVWKHSLARNSTAGNWEIF